MSDPSSDPLWAEFCALRAEMLLAPIGGKAKIGISSRESRTRRKSSCRRGPMQSDRDRS